MAKRSSTTDDQDGIYDPSDYNDRLLLELKGTMSEAELHILRNLEDAKRIVGRYGTEYNESRLHSALGYVTPKHMLDERQQEIFDARDRKLEEPRERRAQARAEQRRSQSNSELSPTRAQTKSYNQDATPEDRALLVSNPGARGLGAGPLKKRFFSPFFLTHL